MSDRWLIEEEVRRRDAQATWEHVTRPRMLDGRPGVVFRKRRAFWVRIISGPIRDLFKNFREWVCTGQVDQMTYEETEFGADFKIEGTGSITQRNVRST